jgi:hypothetical protein
LEPEDEYEKLKAAGRTVTSTFKFTVTKAGIQRGTPCSSSSCMKLNVEADPATESEHEPECLPSLTIIMMTTVTVPVIVFSQKLIIVITQSESVRILLVNYDS